MKPEGLPTWPVQRTPATLAERATKVARLGSPNSAFFFFITFNHLKMFLLYLDESGGTGEADADDYYVLGGISAFETRTYFLCKAEVPMFTDSRLTRMLQLAAFVAYAIFRRYQRQDLRFLDRIIHRFDQTGGKLHGLVHLVANYHECFCPACLTRRNRA